MNFPVLPKPPTSDDPRERYRWDYILCELVNGLRSIILEHNNTQNVELAELTQNDSDGYKHITNAMGNKWEEHVDITDGNPHGTDWDMLEGLASYIPFNIAPGAFTGNPGVVAYNPTEDCFDFYGTNNIIQGGQELAPLYRNATGSTILDTRPVMFAGSVGNSGRLKIQPAIADGSLPAFYTIGLTTEDIANGADGHVTWFGKVRGKDTTGTDFGETWVDGDILYISATTAGYLTNIPPEAPNLRIPVAAVVHAHTNGTLFVRPAWNSKLVDLDDVDGVSPTATGQFLYWSQANGVWKVSSHLKLDDTTNTLESDNDLIIKCPPQKTAKLDTTVWQDIDFPIIIRTTDTGIPTLTTLYTGTYGNITAPQWQVNDSNVCESQEFVHLWREGTACYWHLHLTTNGLDSTDRYVRFGLTYGYNNGTNTAWTFTNLDSGDILIPANTPDKTMLIMPLGNFTPSSGKIGGHAIAILKRIASTGTAPTGNPWVPMLQMHIQCDTLGSRQIVTK